MTRGVDAFARCTPPSARSTDFPLRTQATSSADVHSSETRPDNSMQLEPDPS
jgi:hypothetical protein